MSANSNDDKNATTMPEVTMLDDNLDQNIPFVINEAVLQIIREEEAATDCNYVGPRNTRRPFTATLLWPPPRTVHRQCKGAH